MSLYVIKQQQKFNVLIVHDAVSLANMTTCYLVQYVQTVVAGSVDISCLLLTSVCVIYFM